MGRRTFADSEQSRENNLDLLRLGLALAVILSHSFHLTGFDALEPVFRFTQERVTLGKLAVNAFFVISGYLITNSWVNGNGWKDYTIKRAARIYPAYIAAILLCVLVVAPLAGAQIPGFYLEKSTWRWSIRPLIFRFAEPNLPVFPGTESVGELNGSLWTIRFEIFCYILVAVAGLLGILKRKWLVLGAFVGSLIFYHFQPHLFPSGQIVVPYFDRLTQLPRFVTYFLAGATLYSWRHTVRHSWVLFLVAAVLLGLSRGQGLRLLWPVLLPYCLLFIGLAPRCRLASWLAGADISYGVYLYGWPVQQLVISYLHTTSPLGNALCAMPLACVAGFASWHLLEKHVLKLAKSRKRLHQKIDEHSSPASSSVA